jgi:hypothetical protein
MTQEEVVNWLRAASVEEVSFVFGAAGQFIAIHRELTEAELYHAFAVRAHGDPDCHIVREFVNGPLGPGFREVERREPWTSKIR